MDRREFLQYGAIMLATTPLEVPANRWEEHDDNAQIKDLERRIAELEDRLYSQPVAQRGKESLLSGQVYLNANGLNIINASGVTVGAWQIDGDVFFGTNTNNPPSGVTIAIFNAAQTYNGESVGVGDMLFGDNSSGKANMLWDASAGIFYFRGGTTAKVYINTDGDLYAASGKIRLNSNGLEIRNDSDTRYVKLYNTSITTYTGAVAYMNIDKTDPNGNTYGTAVFGIEHDANNQSNVYCWLNEVDIIIKKAGNWRYVVEANFDYVNFNAPLRITDFAANPSGPSDSTIMNIYQKSSKLIIQYNDGGTVRYKYLDMAGTGATWTHTTSAP